MPEQNLNPGISVGLSFKHPSLLKEGEYSLLVNGGISGVSGNQLLITNEQSNILATKFKEGFRVIGTNLLNSLSTTFFFLVNPQTNQSEIGYILNAHNVDKPDITVDCSDCSKPVVESPPLETTTQYPASVYNTFVNADCLKFDIDHPVVSWIKVDDCNIRIYFNDFKNPFRYIDYKDFQKIDLSNCPLIETNELDCDKILGFPESCYPTVEVVDVVSGGQNKAGVYQFVVSYSDVRSNKLTDYFYVSNPTPLFDQPITIPTDYLVYKSFKLRITNLNTDFKYFNLVVLKTFNNVTTPYLINTFEVRNSTFDYIYTGNDVQTLSIDEILASNPYYNKGKILTESNGYLMQANLEEDRILNLQPVIPLITPKWITVEMNEGDYANPVIAQNYVGYLGDESYALGISYTKTNTKSTGIFPFIGRPANSVDLEVIPETNKDVISNSSCDPQIRNLRWQVYNTATKIQDPLLSCVVDDPTVPNILITDDIECTSVDIIMNTIVGGITTNPSGYNSETGEITYTQTPLFWYAPSTDTTSPNYYAGVYPPQNAQDANAFVNNYLNAPGNPHGISNTNIVNDQNTQTDIGLCDCDVILAQGNYPIGSTVVSQPIITAPYPTCPVPYTCDPVTGLPPDTSLDVLQDELIFTVNTYAQSSVPEIPNPGVYPYSPTPCKKYAGDEDNNEKGYTGWIDAKENGTLAGAETIVQTANNSCSEIQTWGAFIGGNESWYQFYVNNQDGVTSIILSTDKTSNNNTQNNATFEVYESTVNGALSNQVYPVNQTGNTGINLYSISNNDGESAVITGLTPNSAYFIKVIGNYPDPLVLLSASCKRRSFRLCVVTPKPATSYTQITSGVAKITKTCTVTYLGEPLNSCKPQPKEYGEFAYTESQETYPCNDELYGDLAGKPIRHFKFPDATSIDPVYFYEKKGNTPNQLTTNLDKIYPKGIQIDVNQIKFALETAVEKGLITNEEKNQICGYRIHRSNRRGNASVIAKGLLYDIWDYKDNIYNTGNRVLFPNFPFNDLRPNPFLKNKQIKNVFKALDQDYLRPPNNGVSNNKYTLDAPNLSFNNPGLGTELKLEFEQVGVATGNYNELKNNSKYQYIGAGIISASIGFASVEAAFEALNTMANATLSLPITVLGSGTSIPLGLILALIGENILAPQRIYSHYSEWYEIIKKFAPFRNYGTTYSGIGKYITHVANSHPENLRRTIANAQYIKPGIINVKTLKGNTRLNNFKRDSSVFIELEQNSTFLSTNTQDTSRTEPTCSSIGVTGQVASYYASLKNLELSQYGQIDNIEWIDTGYNGRIDWANPSQTTLCDPIFGGDTYIGRFTKKRKTPMFLDDRVIPSDSTNVNLLNQDIQMSLLPNIGYPRYFMDYPTALDYTGITGGLFGDVAVLSKTRADYNFYCFSSDGQSWKDAGLGAAIAGSFAGIAFGVISLPIAVTIASVAVKRDLGNDLFLKGKYIHSFYGITSFLCESDYNLDLRHGENIKEKDFYPNVGDTNEWTQEYFVPMSYDNFYIYNNDYSKQNKENPNFVLNTDFKQTKEDCKAQHPNLLIYSLQDNDQNDKFDGNLIYLANNKFEFPKSAGKLLIVKGLSNGKVLVIQEDGYSVFNSYISQQTNLGIETVGSNSLFNNSIPAQSIKTDLGIGGSQTPAISVTEFGAYWVDNKRGQIIEFQDQLQNIVKPEEEWWFKENLPFKILKDFPDFDITNNFKYVGMVITYDSKFKRIIFSKRDVELKPQFKGLISYDGNWFYIDNLYKITLNNPITGNTYKSTNGLGTIYEKSLVGSVFTISYVSSSNNPISPLLVGQQITTNTGDVATITSIETGARIQFTVGDNNYFCNKSWSISYSPIYKNFLAFHTYYPNYSIENNNYFSTGINYPITGEQEGLWYHGLTNLSYGSYYGKNPYFAFEYSLPTKYQNKVLESVSYIAEFNRFESNLSSYLVNDKTYNKVIIYNQNQCSALLELVPKTKNNRMQFIQYPKQKLNSREILVENIENEWTFNNFSNLATQSGQPILTYDCGNIAYKNLNLLAINYKTSYLKDLMRGDYFVTRLINDRESNYQITHRFSITQTENSNS